MVLDFMLGFRVVELELSLNSLLDYSSGIRKTQADFTSKQLVFTLHVSLRGKVSSVKTRLLIKQKYLYYYN